MAKRSDGRALRFEALERREVLSAAAADYVIHISVDGLRSDVIGTLGAGALPNFFRLRDQGASTANARTDFDFTITLPNHTSQVTGRPVLGANGHGVTFNFDNGGTVHQAKGSYVASAFDVVHDAGLSTGLYVSKDKFNVWERSWNAVNGALDLNGPDNGRDKIDNYLLNTNTAAMVSQYVSDMNGAPFRYSMVHFADPDTAGHGHGWLSGAYLNSVIQVDAMLGSIFALVDGNSTLTGRTAIILTSDHGGEGFGHGDAANPRDYTIPFFVWGPGATAGAELYSMNLGGRRDPGGGRPNNSTATPPIRNGDAANLVLDFLNLPSVPGSTHNAAQDLTHSNAAGDWLGNLYQDVLGRSVSTPEAQYWSARFRDGVNHSDIAAAFLHSPERRGDIIDGYYVKYLGRSAEPAGISFWQGVWNRHGQEAVEASLLGSGEYFFSHGGTNAGFIQGAYADVFGRGISPGETNYWVSVLSTTPRANVAQGLLFSAESRLGAINGWYVNYLNRSSDSSGRGFWLSRLQAGMTQDQIQAIILSSFEYRTL